MNAAVWEDCARLLPDWIDAVFIDLPGHGRQHDVTVTSLDDMVDAVAVVSQRPAVWVGWSLGGLVCLRLAQRYPERVKALLLVAATPRFVQHDNWRCAVTEEVFSQFSELFMKDIDKTIKRFLALQLMGSDDPKPLMKKLEAAIQQRGLPSGQALAVGLDVLEHGDLREDLVGLDTPTAFFLGERDMLVPVALREALQMINPAIEVTTQAGAGHAPFISHPQSFVDAFTRFLEMRIGIAA